MDRFAFDDDYVRRLREHDAQTEQHFYDVFQPWLFSHLRKRVRSRADVEDLRQDTLKRVLQKLYDGDLRAGGALFGFVSRVSDIVLLEYYRQNPRVEPMGDRPDPVDEYDVIVDLITRERQLRVQRVLAELPPGDAKLLRDVFILAVPREEIARKRGVTPEYLRVLLHRALRRFAERFPPDDETN